MAEMTESMRRALSLSGEPDELADYYNEWADTYDEDVAGHDYGLPESIVATIAETADQHPSMAWVRDPHTVILDAGCGTGLVGAALAQAGYHTIDGVDLSTEMVGIAKERGVYRHLEGDVDLTAPPARLAGSADIVTIGGVFTVGHVPPETLADAACLARTGGLLVVSVRKAYLEQTNYLEVSRSLVEAGTIESLVHLANRPYTMDSTADYWAYRVLRATACELPPGSRGH